MTANRARGTESKACEDADDGDDGEEFDEGEGRLLTSRIPGTRFRAQRTQSPDRFGVKTEKIVFCEVNIRGDLSGLGVSKYFLVERGESGCSHSYDHNFRSQISKVKKQFVHLGGVAGGNFDHWVAGGIGFASDQWGDSGGEEGRGGRDGGIDQDGGECILCGVFGVSLKLERKNGFEFFNFDDDNQLDGNECTKYTRHRVSGGAAKVYEFNIGTRYSQWLL